MRSVAPSVTFSTGHFKDDIDQDMDIRNLANGGTLAIYMGIKRLNYIINLEDILKKIMILLSFLMLRVITKP